VIFINTVYEIPSNASCMIGVIAEDFKGIAIKPVQPILSTKPQKPFFILQAADDCIIGKAVFYLVMPEVVRLA
jgi:hypothetical protein